MDELKNGIIRIINITSRIDTNIDIINKNIDIINKNIDNIDSSINTINDFISRIECGVHIVSTDYGNKIDNI